MREMERGGEDTPVMSVRQEVEYSKLEFFKKAQGSGFTTEAEFSLYFLSSLA